ncbi:hypothetical protein GCM10023336_13930 [Streptomyces similanensis]|uniref:Uncharacterized protein n=1 Tax=Streptomyces similanensis TaxID=1274988 RepID=A0ABP9JZJ9_9ACTN
MNLLVSKGDSHPQSFQDHSMYPYDKRCKRVKIAAFPSCGRVGGRGGGPQLLRAAGHEVIFTSGASGAAPREPVPWRFTRTAEHRSRGRTLAPRSPQQSPSGAPAAPQQSPAAPSSPQRSQ